MLSTSRLKNEYHMLIVFGRYVFMLIRCFQYTAGRITLDKVT